MFKSALIALLLTSTLAVCGCASVGCPAPPPSPKLPALDPEMMEPPTGAAELRSTFFKPSTPSSSAKTPKSDGSKTR